MPSLFVKVANLINNQFSIITALVFYLHRISVVKNNLFRHSRVVLAGTAGESICRTMTSRSPSAAEIT